jgi:SAM-dependent MidA family methyltransferase
MLPSSAIPFEQFMAQALHDPERGYYSRRISAVGKRGDFTTAPMLSTAPAKAIAAWAQRAMRETGCRHLIEIGPGEGVLAAGVLKNLPWHLRWRTHLHLVETSIPLATHQQELLGTRAVWHREVKDALAACGGNAVIFSNELVDAFPVRRFQKTTAGWQELAVYFDAEKRPVESLLPLAPLPDSCGFLDTHPIGQWIEVHESYRKYLTEWLPFWKSGKMLTIDYGATTENLYHRRPHGSIRAYLLQHRLEGAAIYENVGRQDLTADVNFTDLMNWSQPFLSKQSLTSLHTFLKGHSDPADQELTDELDAGSAFLVLDQQR